MSFTLDALARLRPFLYHLTSFDNLARIRRTGELESATRLVVRAGEHELLDTRRRGHVSLVVEGETVVLRDQAPLHAGNMRLEDGWTFARVVRHINNRVFFWPGAESGPISYGLRHFKRYEQESPVIVRVPFLALLQANVGVTPELCRYNSGSPRWSRGVAAPRGEKTFVKPDVAPFRAAQVVEVTFPNVVRLPRATSVGQRPGGPWEALFG
jgi:hypothetical protein